MNRDEARRLARHAHPALFQRAHDVRAVLHRAGLDPLFHQGVDSVAAGRALGRVPCELAVAGALRIVRPRPAVLAVQRVPQGIVEPLPSRRGDVEGAARIELQPRRDEVQLDPAALGVAVADPEHVVLLGIEPGEGRALELVHDMALLLGARPVLRCEGDDAAGVAPLPVDRVDQLARHRRIAAQHLGRRMLTVLRSRHVADRSRPRALAAREKLDQHGAAGPAGAPWTESGTPETATPLLSRA